MARIFSKKAFKFRHPTGEAAPVVVQALSFANVPDWVVKSTLFQLASKEGSIDLVEDNKQAAKAEKDAASATLKDLKAKAKELGIEGYGKLGADELTAAIEAAEKAKADNPPNDPPQDPPAGE